MDEFVFRMECTVDELRQEKEMLKNEMEEMRTKHAKGAEMMENFHAERTRWQMQNAELAQHVASHKTALRERIQENGALLETIDQLEADCSAFRSKCDELKSESTSLLKRNMDLEEENRLLNAGNFD